MNTNKYLSWVILFVVMIIFFENVSLHSRLDKLSIQIKSQPLKIEYRTIISKEENIGVLDKKEEKSVQTSKPIKIEPPKPTGYEIEIN